MEPTTDNSTRPILDPELLRRYRIYNPSLFITPLKPGTMTPFLIGKQDSVRRARDWSQSEWPEGANVGIATGSQNHLIVVSASNAKAVKRFFNTTIDECCTSPYAVATHNEVQFYFRTRIDRAPASCRLESLNAQGIDVHGEGRFVPGAGSILNGSKCKTLLDATLELPNIPEPSRHLADLLGLAELSAHPAYKPRMRML